MTEWRFYGREPELEKVDSALRYPKFVCKRIHGRRGVGKAELVAEAGRRTRGKPPVLIFELRSPELESAEAARQRLLDTAGNELGPEILQDLPHPHPVLPADNFTGVVRHLLFRDVAVTLDGFHHARPMGLEGPIKLLIDHSGPLHNPRPTGKLFVMGSHQQRFMAMFRSDQPLFQRFYGNINLHQWQAPTVLEMAAEHDFLRNPGRFLTLWTACGGIPRNWEAFANSDESAARLRDFSRWPDDDSWRRAFLGWQEERLRGPDERFDSRSYVELDEPHRKVLEWLAHNKARRGSEFWRFPEELRDRAKPGLAESLKVLSSHLELVERVGEFWRKPALTWRSDLRWQRSPDLWRIRDNDTLFQLAVTGTPEPGNRENGNPRRVGSMPRTGQMLEALENLEGPALERFAADWLRNLPCMGWSGHGCWRRQRGTEALGDVDAMALPDSEEGTPLVLASCKRDPAKHNPGRLSRQLGAFLEDVGTGKDDDEGAEWLRSLPQRRLLISPEFTEGQRSRFAETGFECIGIRDMARELGIDPGPSAQG